MIDKDGILFWIIMLVFAITIVNYYKTDSLQGIIEEKPHVQKIEELNNQLDSLGAKMLQFDRAISATEYIIYISDGKEWLPLYYVEKRESSMELSK